MRILLSLAVAGAALLAAQPPKPVAAKAESVQVESTGVKRAAMQAIEKGIDARFDLVNASDPIDLLGNTRGVYLPGYGVVLTSEVALVKVAGISPFHQTFSAEERERARARKLRALPKLRDMMRAALLSAGTDLRSVPLNENIVFAVTLFSYFFEDTNGLPSQIVMQATRQQLVTHQTTDAIKVQEF